MSIVVVFGITLSAFLLVIVGMAVGVLMGRRAISGSCGGLANQSNEHGEKSCSLCSNPDAACRELRRRMIGESGTVEESGTGHSSESLDVDAACDKAEMSTCTDV